MTTTTTQETTASNYKGTIVHHPGMYCNNPRGYYYCVIRAYQEPYFVINTKTLGEMHEELEKVLKDHNWMSF